MLQPRRWQADETSISASTDPRQIRPSQSLEIARVDQDLHAGVVHVEKVLQARKVLVLFDRLRDRGEMVRRQFDIVLARELKQQGRFERAFNVQVVLALFERVKEYSTSAINL